MNSSKMIRHPYELSRARLTEILRRTGALTAGEVAGLEVFPARSDNSRVYRVRISYSEEAEGVLPQTLFLKLCDSVQFAAASEPAYYARDYITLQNAPILRCYDAGHDASEESYYLLLEDVTDTHKPSWEVQPTLQYGRALAEAVAKLHAHHWVNNELGAGRPGSQPVPEREEIERYLSAIRPGLDPLLEACRQDIPDLWTKTLPLILEKHPERMIERTRSHEGFTLIHGDLNPGNILIRHNGLAPMFLIDRQPFVWSLTCWLGVSDLAYAMIHWWDTESRRALEFQVLQQYHEVLRSNGVNLYSWEQLCLDYRLCVVQSLYVAVEWCADPSQMEPMRWVWYPQLQKAMTAFFDLKVSELL
ncbi:phosphotransferase family protein [Paenibacillus aceris]|uniref:Thiamine kinase-like enzyme n=1 Tax=Paenibacillus aceris TaxID=869555 RepID=A0ABS4HYL1_9BACL|nr:phosphotransferase [Paenibacillus aceris]MBP1963291.1 thiamine kinase-like enzyme [Paenibacillus aceris]NHW36203.1 phosphotransferase [Paenibacillus aceris]